MDINTALDMRSHPYALEIGGKTYPLDFDMQALAYAEQTYIKEYDRQVNGAEILAEIYLGNMSALMTMTYGAIRSAGTPMTWQQFTKEIFTYEQYGEIQPIIEDAVTDMFANRIGVADEEPGGEKN